MTAPSESGPRPDQLIGLLPRTRSAGRWVRLWRPFWVLPSAIVLAAALVGVFLPELERGTEEHLPYVFSGGPTGARDLLGNIAGAMISVTGLVFSITMIVVQLASSQFTPRALDDFLASRVTQVTLGVFAASFVFALTVLRSVQGSGEGRESFVPQISVTLAFLLVLASVGMFMAFIHHITSSIKVSAIVSHLGSVTVGVVERYFPSDHETASAIPAPVSPFVPPPGLEAREVSAKGHGYVVEIDLRTLIDHAASQDAVVEVLVPVGDFIIEGTPVARVWRDPAPDLDDSAQGKEDTLVRRAVTLAQDRWFHQDPAFGIRKLVDIAERALSPGINDPTTATQVIDELHRILARVVPRCDLPEVVTYEGRVRLVHRPQRISDLLDLSVEEIAHYGGDSLQVPRRLQVLLRDLERVTRPEHRPRLEHWQDVTAHAPAAEG